MTEEKECPTVNENLCFAERLKEATYYYNLGYRKLPEDSVVLSMEEYKRLLDNAIRADMEYLDNELAKASKETAEKILNLIETFCSDNEFIEIVKGVIKKEFDIEIKEEK
jgi:hypothetical protein